MKTYILLSEKSWHDDLYMSLQKDGQANWVRISSKSDFSLEKLNEINPDKIFIPHWSSIIPPEIFNQFECIVFHMTDLPYGQGGTPLQNLIVNGHEKTKISALCVNDGIDTGEIYLKESLSLYGTAEEIFIRASKIIYQMIKRIIIESPIPMQQQGNAVNFKRRKPEDSNISKLHSIEAIYDYIRMLDCEGYPNAYIEVDEFRFEFTRASLKGNNSIIADVRITKK
jgi:methionyl-tRNA formyltransferase